MDATDPPADQDRLRRVARAIGAHWSGNPVPPHPADGRVRVMLRQRFHVVVIPSGSTLRTRLFGWDRDLTELLKVSESDFAELPALLGAVDRVVDELCTERSAPAERRPTPTPDEARALWAARREAALAARSAAPRPLLDGDSAAALVTARWPGATEVESGTEGAGRWVTLRPRGSSRVGFGPEEHDAYGGSILVGRESTGLPDGLWSRVRRDEHEIGGMLDRVDSWLVRTMPPAWVLELPVEDES